MRNCIFVNHNTIELYHRRYYQTVLMSQVMTRFVVSILFGCYSPLYLLDVGLNAMYYLTFYMLCILLSETILFQNVFLSAGKVNG